MIQPPRTARSPVSLGLFRALSVAVFCCLAAGCSDDGADPRVDAGPGAEADASAGSPDAAAHAPDAAADAHDAAAIVCESRTFACGDTTCDARDEYCSHASGSPLCESVRYPGECYPCSTQVDVDSCGDLSFPELDSDNGSPPGCTLECL